MGFIKEFKEFAIKGNMFEMAIGIIMGLAFNTIINSLVKDIIMPVFGYIIGGVNFRELKWLLRPANLDAKGEVIQAELAIRYGNFIQESIDFLIIAFSIFLVIKSMNRLKRKAEDVEDKDEPTPKDIKLLSDIKEGINKLNRDKF